MSSKDNVLELRELAKDLIVSKINALYQDVAYPKSVVLNILMGNHQTYADMPEETKRELVASELANQSNSIINRFTKTTEMVRASEQIIRICDNILDGGYDYKPKPDQPKDEKIVNPGG